MADAKFNPKSVDGTNPQAPEKSRQEKASTVEAAPPPDVIEPDRELTAEERAAIGERAVIKPSFGEAAKGCMVGVEPTLANIKQARDYERKFDWLIQKMITWTKLGNRPAYLRAYNVCGHRTLMWWAMEKGEHPYQLLSWRDLRNYDLMGAVEIIDRLAEVTGMDFFSTEIAITKESGSDRFVLIDYVNDQCDMDPTDSPYSPPEPFCRFICQSLAEFTYRRKQGLPAGMWWAPSASALRPRLRSASIAQRN